MNAVCKDCFGLIAALQGKTTNLWNYLRLHLRAHFDNAIKT